MPRHTTYVIALTNKEILQMYYSQNVKLINVSQIQKIFGCEYKKAAKLRNIIQAQLVLEGKEALAKTGYVPFDMVLKEANLTIETVERNYKKQIKLGI